MKEQSYLKVAKVTEEDYELKAKGSMKEILEILSVAIVDITSTLQEEYSLTTEKAQQFMRELVESTLDDYVDGLNEDDDEENDYVDWFSEDDEVYNNPCSNCDLKYTCGLREDN